MTKWDEIRENARKNETEHVKETLWTNRIVRIILLILTILLIAGGIFAYLFVSNALTAVDEESTETVQVTIPYGSTTSDVADILYNQGIVKNRDIFSFYMKANNDQELQAGHYEFSPSMNAEVVLQKLQEGGEPIFVDVDTTITVVEGVTIEDVAKVVDENTAISEEEFLEQIQDTEFITELEEQFPSLLGGIQEIENLKYTLEGYLYPATYDYFAGMTAKELITEMVSSTNLTYQRLLDDLVNTHLNYHEILTLGSLIEKEAITQEDRELVSGVFYNRLAIDMPLQTDVTIIYALGEHREFVTYEDLEVDSPYNTYLYPGLPPGPVATVSYSALTAAIYPTYSDYYYFVADIDTQEIYYSATLEEHELLVEQYVNSRQTTEENLEETLEYDAEVYEEETAEEYVE